MTKSLEAGAIADGLRKTAAEMNDLSRRMSDHAVRCGDEDFAKHAREMSGAAALAVQWANSMETEMKRWETFWFETNVAWGLVDSPEAWAKMRADWNAGFHGMKPDEIYKSRSFDRTNPRDGDVPNFGSRSEHIGGKTTLGEFFDANGMSRDVGA